MCVAIPALIVSVEGDVAQVELGGARRQVGLQLVPGAKVGDYVLVHTGFAISVLDPDEAEATLSLFRELEAFERAAEEDEPS